jgi:hypothetical protein
MCVRTLGLVVARVCAWAIAAATVGANASRAAASVEGERALHVACPAELRERAVPCPRGLDADRHALADDRLVGAVGGCHYRHVRVGLVEREDAALLGVEDLHGLLGQAIEDDALVTAGGHRLARGGAGVMGSSCH